MCERKKKKKTGKRGRPLKMKRGFQKHMKEAGEISEGRGKSVIKRLLCGEDCVCEIKQGRREGKGVND